MNNFWMIAAISFAIAFFICLMCLVKSIKVVRKASKREKSRRERILQRGVPVIATVKKVVLQTDRKEYKVYASWYSYETRKEYQFQETYTFPMIARLFPMIARRYRPKIPSDITVRVLFHEPIYHIDQDW